MIALLTLFIDTLLEPFQHAKLASAPEMELPKLKTLDNEVVFDDAVQGEHNMLLRLTYWQKKFNSCYVPMDSGAKSKALVSSHLRLKRPEDCQGNATWELVSRKVQYLPGIYNVTWCRGYDGYSICRLLISKQQ